MNTSVDITPVDGYYKVNTICLPQKNDTQENEEMALVVGWNLFYKNDRWRYQFVDRQYSRDSSGYLQMGYMKVMQTPTNLPNAIMKLARIENSTVILGVSTIITLLHLV